LGIVEGLAGEPAAAERALRQSYELFEAEGDTGHVAFAAALLSRALYDLGRDEEAERLTRVSEQAAAPDDAGTQMQWRSVRAKVLARRGELQPAEALARDAARIGRSTELHMLADVVMDLGEVLAAAGRPEEAVSHVEEAIERYERKGNVVAAERARRVLSRLQEVRTSS
jgi:tetratricopeptide (TPR) repeat protein